MIVVGMVTAALSLGLVMVLLTVKIKHGDVTSHAMIMMVVIVVLFVVMDFVITCNMKMKIIVQKIVVKVKPVKHVNITIPTMVLNVVILPGMNME